MFGLTFLLNVPGADLTGTAPKPAWWMCQRMDCAKPNMPSTLPFRTKSVRLAVWQNPSMPRTALAEFGGIPKVVENEMTQPVIVFDGVCVLCSGFMRFVLRHDRAQIFRFVVAQSPSGQALYRHFSLNPTDFETNLVIKDGMLFTELAAFAAVMLSLPWPWRVFAAANWVPPPFSRWLYRAIADNRYRLFGRTETCLVPSAELRQRFIVGGF